MPGWRKVVGIVGGVLAVVVVVGLPITVGIRPFIGPRIRPVTNRHFDPTPERLARGTYLVTSGAAPCVLCHSPMNTAGGGLRVDPGTELTGRNWAPDGAPFLTAPNLTPDPETGIASWTDDQLARAIREGISHDGRALFPIMPYEKFRNLPDEDLASIIVYLRAQKPVRHPLPPTHIPFPLNRLINGVPETVEAVAAPDGTTPERRGAQLAAIAVCADCHSTRDVEGNAVKGMIFGGGTPLPFAGRTTIYSANLTPAVNGIPYYNEALFLEVMRTGKVRARQLDDMMPTHYYGKMSDQDLKDIYAYLKTLAPVDHYVDNSLPPTKCARCGMVHGGGERNKKPA